MTSEPKLDLDILEKSAHSYSQAGYDPQTLRYANAILALLAERRRLKQQIEKVREYVEGDGIYDAITSCFKSDNRCEEVGCCATSIEAALEEALSFGLSDQQIADSDAGDAKQRVREKSK